MTEDDGSRDNLIPLVIGVTGHRDLRPDETDELRALIAELFASLRKRFPHTPLLLMTALAEGADRLAAHAAIEAGVDVRAVLPMPAESYREDFLSPESKAEFDSLCAKAKVIELPLTRAEHAALKTPGRDRDLSYAKAGMFISAHCHILLAVWDRVESDNVGGTSQIIYFQHYDRLPGIAESVPRTSLFLTDDESDLVYEITCSRSNSTNGPSPSRPLERCWFTTDPDAPRVKELPQRYVRVFHSGDEYNRDIRRLVLDGSFESAESSPPERHAAAQGIRRAFDVANTLANHFQRRVELTLIGIYALALLTGLTFIFYSSELGGVDPLIYGFLAFLISGVVLAAIARRREWHRKYLDYRVLAEGLRVQFYWSIAGVRVGGQTKFAYDNFLRQRDMELGWIRNVMRVAGTLNDAHGSEEDDIGLKFAIEHWIGTEERPGQRDYYQRKAARRAHVNRLTASITWIALWGGIVVALVLAVSLGALGESVQNLLVILMGVLTLMAGVAEVYTQRKADRELVKQYRFMEHVFANARRRLDEAANDEERREILRGLGDAALSEHAEWILIHRERQPEPGGL